MFRLPVPIVRIAIIAAVALGALFFRDRISGGAGDLKAGDCFDNPAATIEVRDVQHHPCTEPHTSEVVFVGTMPSADAYPTDAQFSSYVSEACVPGFNAYTGLDFMSLPAIDMGYFIPTTDGWGNGDRSVICYAVRTDDSMINASLKAAS